MADTSPLAQALSDRYVIERELGQGGMATVYLAHDVKHDRKVAVKVLRPELAAVLGTERFLNEIKVTANLSHPHILPLLDSGRAVRHQPGRQAGLAYGGTAVGEPGEFLYYVMPYVEGESLRDRLDREKQLSIEESVKITESVASALDYAHRHNVIHRDIKPENILLHDGQPVVADFGISLAVSAAGGTRITETGLSLGTPQYMSPEQATGDREVDGRSDIYSLACVLYEMLSGEPPHTGPTVQAVMAKVVTDHPRPIVELRDTVPSHVSAAMQKALAKLPADRFETANSFAARLGHMDAFDGTPDPTAHRSAERGSGRSWLSDWRTWVLVAAASLVTFASTLYLRSGRESRAGTGERGLIRFSITLPDSTPLVLTGRASLGIERTAFAISDDGGTLVYVGRRDDGSQQLFLRHLDQYDVVPIPGTEGASQPFFSPDGRRIGFLTDNQVQTISLQGGEALVLADAARPTGAVWWRGDRILYFVEEGRRLMWVSANSGTPTEIPLSLGQSRGMFRYTSDVPEILPEGERILVSSENEILAISLVDGSVDVVRTPGEHPRLLPGGYLAFLQGDELAVTRFDNDELTTYGTTTVVESGIRSRSTSAQFAITDQGTLFYVPGRSTSRASFAWQRRDGTTEELPFASETVYQLSLSPNGRELAASVLGATYDVWIYDLQTSQRRRLTRTGNNVTPVWSPDGRYVYFSSDRDGMFGVYRRYADGSAPAELVVPTDGPPRAESVSRDGLILYSTADQEEGDCFLYDPENGNNVEFSALPAVQELHGSFSPDGRWVAYTSDESGSFEVYVRSVDQGPKRQVSFGGGEEPVWARSGEELFFRDGNRLLAASFTTAGDSLVLSPPAVLLEIPRFENVGGISYAVSSDGFRFLVLLSPFESTTTEIRVVQGWMGLLATEAGER